MIELTSLNIFYFFTYNYVTSGFQKFRTRVVNGYGSPLLYMIRPGLQAQGKKMVKLTPIFDKWNVVHTSTPRKVVVIHVGEIILSCFTFCKQMHVGRRRFFFGSFFL